MHVSYKNSKVRKQCKELSKAKKIFPEKVAKKLHKLINFIEAADNLESVKNMPMYRFHDLKGDREGYYSLDIDGIKSSYRLIVSFDDISKDDVFQSSIDIEDIEIEEVSKHYE